MVGRGGDGECNKRSHGYLFEIIRRSDLKKEKRKKKKDKRKKKKDKR